MQTYNGHSSKSLSFKGKTLARMEFRLSEALKEEIGKAADAAGIPMNEYMARVLALHIGKPELSHIPRISIGRPRKDRPRKVAV